MGLGLFQKAKACGCNGKERQVGTDEESWSCLERLLHQQDWARVVWMRSADSCFLVDPFAPHLFSGRTAFVSLIFTPGFVYLLEISSFLFD